MAALPPVSQDVLNPILQQAWQASPLVQYAYAENYLYNQAVLVEQGILLDFVGSKVDFDVDLEQLQSQVLQRVDNDIAITASLNDAVAYVEFYTNQDLTYSLKTNKMNEALIGARDIIADADSFVAIITGSFPEGFGGQPSFPVIIAEDGTPFGNSQNTFLNTAIIEIATTLLGENAGIEDLNQALSGQWIDHSAITHVTPVNPYVFEIDDGLFADYAGQYTFSFGDNVTPIGLAFVHSGYAFGGFRDEARYSEGKLFGPEDCSSWIAKICDCEIAFSTVDMLYAYRLMSEGNKGYIDQNWINTDVADTMVQTFTPVQINDPFTDIQAGQIITFRKFDSEDHDASAGYSGHIALVLGVTEQGEVVTLNYTRDMPQIEGFGISLYDYQSSDVSEVFFMELNNTPIKLEDIFQAQDHDLAFWQDTPLPIAEIGHMDAYLQPILFENELEPMIQQIA